MVALKSVARCVGCGCTDLCACPGGCYWLRVDYAAGEGVCSCCQSHVAQWDEQHSNQSAAELTDGSGITWSCLCQGRTSPGHTCSHVDVSNKNICGYKGDEFCEFRHPGCQRCGAKTSKEAETMCRVAGGDDDDCHGCALWPD